MGAIRTILAAGSLPAVALSGAQMAIAADTAPNALAGGEEIIVTAERRSEGITRTPIAISAFSGDFIAQHRLDSIKDLVIYTPGFSGNSDGSWIDSLAIRGITSNDYGIGGDPSISIFKDGVWQGRTGSAVTSLFDIERAEALRGPQGFLFGRNAISGAINIVTNKPVIGALGARVYATAGSLGHREAEAALNVPAGEHWAFRLAGYHVANRGWADNIEASAVKNRLGAQSRWAGRASALYDNGTLRIVATAEAERRRAGATGYRASNGDREMIDAIAAPLGVDLVIRGGARDVDSDLADPQDMGTVWGGNVQADLDLGFAKLTSISAYRHHRFFYSEDYDGTPLLIDTYLQRQHGGYASQEFRLVSPNGQRLTWSAGLSAYRETVRARFDNIADENFVCKSGYGYASCDELTQDLHGIGYVPTAGSALDDRNFVRTTNSGLSLYADANYRVTDALQAGLGLRYGWDHKRFGIDVPPSESTLGNIWNFTYYTDGFLARSKTWTGATPRLYVRYQAARGLNLYASVARGYKAGGFGSFTLEAPLPIDSFSRVPPGTRPDDFEPETIWSKEAGIKGSLFNRRLQFDLTGFHYVYSNLQMVYTDTTTRTQQVANIGKVHGYGAEASATYRPTAFLDLFGTLAYTHTKKTGDRGCAATDCGGLPNPIWASSGVATLHTSMAAGEAHLAAEWNYQGRARNSFDWRGYTRRKGYRTANLRLGYKSDRGWEVEAYVQNLFDATYYSYAYDNGDLIPATLAGVSRPRSGGISLRWSGRGK